MNKKIGKQGFVLCLVALVVSLARATDSEAPPSELFSPDKTQKVEIIEKAMPGADPEGDCYTLVLTAHGKTIGKFATQGYLINAFWSPDNKYVAVNNRRANAGDYLWVLSSSDSHAVKIPDDSDPATQALVDRVVKKFPEYKTASYDRSLVEAWGWTPAGELTVKTRLSFDHVPFLFVLADVYKIEGGKLVLEATMIEKKAL